MARSERSTVLTIRVPNGLDRRIEQTARRRRRTKSALVREALEQTFGAESAGDDPAREARRQSLMVSARASEREAIDFVVQAADDRGWR